MYCTLNDVIALLPATVTIGTRNLGTPTIGAQVMQKNQITPDDMTNFIRYATQEVDSRLRPFYLCPLRRIKLFETEITNSVLPGTNISVRVHDSGMFAKGMMVRLQDRFYYESAIVSDVPDLNTVVIQSVASPYSQYNGVISILQFPDPIPLMTARMALSYGFDKLFAAEQSPDVSNYGVAQRTLAMNAMDNILAGSIMLTGQEWTGRRFIRMPLLDAFSSPVKELQFGREGQGK